MISWIFHLSVELLKNKTISEADLLSLIEYIASTDSKSSILLIKTSLHNPENNLKPAIFMWFGWIKVDEGLKSSSKKFQGLLLIHSICILGSCIHLNNNNNNILKFVWKWRRHRLRMTSSMCSLWIVTIVTTPSRCTATIRMMIGRRRRGTVKSTGLETTTKGDLTIPDQSNIKSTYLEHT